MTTPHQRYAVAGWRYDVAEPQAPPLRTFRRFASEIARVRLPTAHTKVARSAKQRNRRNGAGFKGTGSETPAQHPQRFTAQSLEVVGSFQGQTMRVRIDLEIALVVGQGIS